MTTNKRARKLSPFHQRMLAARLMRKHGLPGPPSNLVVRCDDEAAVRRLVLERIALAAPAGPMGWLSQRAGSGRDVAYRFAEGRTTTSANLLQILDAVGVALVVDPKWDPKSVPVIR